MRLTIGRKLNALILTLQLLSIGGTAILATRLFTSDLTGLLRGETLAQAGMLAARVRAELKSVADRARILGAASIEEFQYPEDRLKFIQDNLTADSQLLGLSLYKNTAGTGWTAGWRIAHPSLQKRLSVTSQDFADLDRAYPLNLAAVSGGEADFTTAKLKDGTPALRMAIPFVQREDGSFSQILIAELQQEKLSALFSESSSTLSYLTDRKGMVLATSDPGAIKPGSSASAQGIVAAAIQPKASKSQQLDFIDGSGTQQIAAYQMIGFANLSVVTQIPMARALAAQETLYRRTSLLAGVFLCLALALGFWFSQTLTRPIHALAHAAEKVKQGDFSIRLETKAGAEATTDASRARGDEIQQFSGTFNEMVSGLQERDRIKSTFAKFHSKEIADKVLSGELRLGGERKSAIVFFSDVRGFTSFSERVNPEALVSVLNRYMSRMVRIILDQEGIVDKYVGDAIMAVWGAPISRPDDAIRAVRACLRMREALADFNEELKREGIPPFKIGMGLNFGPLIAGNIGSEERMEYTVIGDTVNTASRIESLTKSFGTDLLISQSVVDQLENRFLCERTFEAKVKGKADSLVVYKVNGYIDENGREIRVETPYSTYEAEKSDKVVSTGEPKPAEMTTLTRTATIFKNTGTVEISGAAEMTTSPSIRATARVIPVKVAAQPLSLTPVETPPAVPAEALVPPPFRHGPQTPPSNQNEEPELTGKIVTNPDPEPSTGLIEKPSPTDSPEPSLTNGLDAAPEQGYALAPLSIQPIDVATGESGDGSENAA